MVPNQDEYVLMGTERQDSMTRPYFKQIATLSSKYKKIIFPFLHPESKEATSEAVGLHSFCIRASPVSRCPLQVGPSVDGLLCNTCLTSTCGSKVHRVPFVSPSVVLGGHRRLVSQLLPSVNTSVDGSERGNEGGGCLILTGSSPSPVQRWGTLRVMAVFGSASVSYCQAGTGPRSSSTWHSGATRLYQPDAFKKISLLYLWGEIKFPRAAAAAQLSNNNLICSLEDKETALMSNLTAVIYLVYILYI